MHLDQTNALDDGIDLTLRGNTGQTHELVQQPFLVGIEHAFKVTVKQRLVPIRPSIDSNHLRSTKELAHGPHERSIDANQLVPFNRVGLVQDAPNLIVIVRSDRFDHLLEFVTNIQFVGIKQQQN